jgi:Recombinase
VIAWWWRSPLVLVAIFKRYASRRHGSAAIPGWLNDEPIRTKRGRKGDASASHDLLRNTTYIDELPFKGGKFPSQHEPIIARETLT